MTKSMIARASGLVSVLCSISAAVLLALPGAASAQSCPNEAFRTGASANLPDCRAYELVTPPFKEAARAELQVRFGGFAGMSDDGSRVAVTSSGNFGDAQGAFEFNTYELPRTESGWGETNIDLPASQFPGPFRLIRPTPNFEKFLYAAKGAWEDFEYTTHGDFLIRESDGTLRDLGSTGGRFAGASQDLSQVVVSNGGALYQKALAEGSSAVLISVDPSGNPCSEGLGYRGMSVDASTVFFECAGELFARINESQTVAISEPAATDCSACDTSSGVRTAATTIGSSADGSKVFFSTTQPLLGGDASENIYEYDFDAPAAGAGDPNGRVVEVSSGDWGPGGAQVHGESVKVSEDGSHVYFIASGVSSGVKNSQGVSPVEGEENLYVFERDTQFPNGRLSFIATLAGSENFKEEGGCGRGGVFVGCGATVTPDGHFFVFMTYSDITPDDTSTARQVFEYSAQTGDLVRVSIGQNGFNDNGNTNTFNASIPPQAHGFNSSGQYSQGAPPLAVSNDGSYVVFESPDGLTPQALNGYGEEFEYELFGERATEKYHAENVYEYHNGNVYLISDGQDTFHEQNQSTVQLRGISPSGTDIFFETIDRLVPQDLDTQKDVYDARIGGGFPAPVSVLPTCSGDACQGQLSPSPVLLSPGSEFQAGGNPPLDESPPAVKAKPKVKATSKKKCGKGLEKRRGKCVKKKKPRRAAKPAGKRR